MTDTLASAHRTHARELWALCYRMLGVAADADEVVQETFVRALESKPEVSDEKPLKPWLFSIAARLCVDRLRRRRAQGYVGPWLPSPVDDDELQFEAPASARYEVIESASVAFLLALEALSPEQRAVLLLRDVFDLTSKEVGELLDESDANVRQLHHRARTALERYDAGRIRLDDATRTRAREAMEKFFTALSTGDVETAKSLLADDVVLLSDGGGEYLAARQPLHGPSRVMLFLSRLIEMRGIPSGISVRLVNGGAAVDATYDDVKSTEPPRAVTGVNLDAQGRISLMFSVVARSKLRRR
ncbi:MAG: sigma-70 family RNA polymerase sigma factor [Archangium sp.]